MLLAEQQNSMNSPNEALESHKKESVSSQSLYHHLYSNNVDCADHLCNAESSDVDSAGSLAEGDAEELYRSWHERDEQSGSLPVEFIRRANSTVASPVIKLPYGSMREVASEISDGKVQENRPVTYAEDDEDDDEDDSIYSDPFFGYSDDKSAKNKGPTIWSDSKFNPFKKYTKIAKALGMGYGSSDAHENEADDLVSIWTDFSQGSGSFETDKCVTGSVEGKDSVNLALSKRGFYTLFLKSGKDVEKTKQDISPFKIKFKYTILDCKRKKLSVKAFSSNTEDGSAESNFIAHDPFDEDCISFMNQGTVAIGGKSLKIVLLKAGHDTVLQFSILYSMLDFRPVVLYKLVYCGWLSTIPLSMSPNLRLRILSIDSCENLGTSALAVLYAIEQRLSTMHGSNVKLADYFDIICGTGTGAILALCLLKGYSIKELKVQWQSLISGLFRWSHSLPYGLVFDHANVYKFILHWIEILGIDFMCTKQKPLCIVTSTNVKPSSHELFVFRNYTNFHSPYAGTTQVPLWLAGWASNALPTYMKGPSDSFLKSIGCKVDREAHFVDGQMLCTNPSLVALQEACELYGFTLRKLIDDNIEMFLSIGTARKESKGPKIRDLQSWQILLNNKSSANTQIEHSHTQQLFAEHPERYQRIEIQRLQGCKYGKTDKATVDKTFNQALNLVNTYTGLQLERIAKSINI